MKPLVIYHGGCFDGFTAAWVARKALGECDLHPATWTDTALTPPNVEGREVYCLDFSYPREVMIKMNEQANRFVVLDHHKTAEADCEGLDFCTFDMERAGCGMTWDFFFPKEERPHWLNLIEDRDLWKFKFGKETKRFQAYIASVPMVMEQWDAVHFTCADLVDDDMQDLLDQGESILRYIDQYCKEIGDNARTVKWGDYKAVITNCPYLNCSEVGHHLLERFPKARFSCTYYQNDEGIWVYSLRCRDDFDVSGIARAFGGGGHAQSAGFQTKGLFDNDF